MNHKHTKKLLRWAEGHKAINYPGHYIVDGLDLMYLISCTDGYWTLTKTVRKASIKTRGKKK